MSEWYVRVPSPVGVLLLTANDEALTGVHFGGEETPAPGVEAPEHPVLAEAATQLAEYFAGRRREFALPLAPEGTAFQRQVWEQLRRIPFGATISYGELARRVGSPGAARAVGLANGRNPIAVVIPCHRVIGADGSLTGFGGGLERKQALLALEAGEGALPLEL